jgi:protocatechuate 3,4-dioxygenase beta subunit
MFPPRLITAVLLLTALAVSTVQAAPESGSPVRGSVVDAKTGNPIPNATVYVYTARPRKGTSPFCPSCYPDCGKTTRTGKRGAFLVASLSKSLIFRFLVIKPGFEPLFVEERDPKRVAQLRVSLKPRPVTRGDVERTVQATLRDPQNQPVVGATVEFVGFTNKSGGGSFGSIAGYDALTIADEKGWFSLRCARKDVSVFARVRARGLAPRMLSGLLPGAKSQTITLGYGASVLGTVRNGGGKPVPNAVVQFVPVNRNSDSFTGWEEIGTDAQGNFALSNIPADIDGYICVRMDSMTGDGATARQRIRTPGEGATLENTMLHVTVGHSLAGRVILPDGAAVPPGTRVMLGRAEMWDTKFATADAKGNFSFRGVPSDEPLDVSVRVPGYRFSKTTPGLAPHGYFVVIEKLRAQTEPVRLILQKRIKYLVCF